MNTICFRFIAAKAALLAAEAERDLCALALQARKDLGIEPTSQDWGRLDVAQDRVFDAEVTIQALEEPLNHVYADEEESEVWGEDISTEQVA